MIGVLRPCSRAAPIPGALGSFRSRQVLGRHAGSLPGVSRATKPVVHQAIPARSRTRNAHTAARRSHRFASIDAEVSRPAVGATEVRSFQLDAELAVVGVPVGRVVHAPVTGRAEGDHVVVIVGPGVPLPLPERVPPEGAAARIARDLLKANKRVPIARLAQSASQSQSIEIVTLSSPRRA